MVFNKIKTYGELVMFSHTLFSLPFALISMLWASNGVLQPEIFLWGIIALFAGRNGANALNRWVDRRIDKKNPRTANRHIPQGTVKPWEAFLLASACFLIFIIAAYQINTLCFYLSPIAISLFVLYSYTKRFTWSCHLVLGITCAGAPVGAWLAVTGKWSFVPIMLGAVVMLWVAGFDIIYGTQDIKFDLENKIYSIPARFGLKYALVISKIFHGLMIIILVMLGVLMNVGLVYYLGILLSSLLLMIEHKIVRPSNPLLMNIASYRINQIVSVLIFFAVVLDFFTKTN